MKVNTGHLTYCTNIHPGQTWKDAFQAIKNNLPLIKQAVSPDNPFAIGLRLSNESSIDLEKDDALSIFKDWLKENNAYVFTMNGFPYGDFHHTSVKDNVHAPDWTTAERVEYTNRLFRILQKLLPDGMEGGISTSPLSYRYWFDTETAFLEAKHKGTLGIINVLKELVKIASDTGCVMHLDIEPEADGILESGREFIDWYTNDLLPLAITILEKEFSVDKSEAEMLVKRHICLCYDVCHFAIGYENHAKVLEELKVHGIQVGKIQISAALKANLAQAEDIRIDVKSALEKFNEPTYLHQVVASTLSNDLIRYRDLSPALAEFERDDVVEWRAHFHVPISIRDIGTLESTQDDIIALLDLQKQAPFCDHLEVETYTWEVLPDQLKTPIAESIINELEWVIKTEI